MSPAGGTWLPAILVLAAALLAECGSGWSTLLLSLCLEELGVEPTYLPWGEGIWVLELPPS